MQLSPPKQSTFFVAVILAALGVLSSFGMIPVLSGYSFWLVVLGFIVLAAGNLTTGL